MARICWPQGLNMPFSSLHKRSSRKYIWAVENLEKKCNVNIVGKQGHSFLVDLLGNAFYLLLSLQIAHD